MDTGSEVCFKPRCPLSTLHHLLFSDTHSRRVFECRCLELSGKWRHFRTSGFNRNNDPIAWTQVPKFVLSLDVHLALSITFYFSDTHSRRVFECRCLELSGKWRHFRTCGFHHNNGPIAWTQVPKFFLSLDVPLVLSIIFYFSDTHSRRVFECRCLELSGKWRHFRTRGFYHNNRPIAWTQVQKFVLSLDVPLALSITFYFSDTHSRRVFECSCLELSGKWRHFRTNGFHHDNGPIAWTQVP